MSRPWRPAPMPLPLALAALAALAGCTDFPELDAKISDQARAADAPVLMDNRPLLARAETARIDEATDETLRARAAALQGRRDGAAQTVLSPAERDEIAAAHGRLRAAAASVVAPDP